MTAAPRWAALVWLDWRLLVNRVRSIARNPRRLVPWLIFLVWLLPSFFTRVTFGMRLGGGNPLPPLALQLEPLAVLVPGVALFALGFAVWRSSMAAPAAFQSPADARFVIGAGFDSRAIFAWLSLRTARRLIVSFALLLVFVQVLYLPWLGVSLATALPFTAAIGIFGAIVFGARLFAFTMQRAAPAVPVGAVGMIATVAGGALTLAALAHVTGTAHVPAQLLAVNAVVPPGSWMVRAMGGDVMGDAGLLAAALALIGGGIALAGDCYPELWAASARAIALRRAMHDRGGLFGYTSLRSQAARERKARDRQVRSATGDHVPGGALAVFWKEWLTVRRSRGGLELQLAILAGALALGILMGYAMAHGSRIAGAVAALFVVLAVFSSWAAGIQLGRDVGNPLWWLSSAALSGRLVAWSIARALRFAVPLIAFSVAGLIAFADYAWALPLAVAVPLLVCWMSQAIGLAVYAMLPAKTDYRLAMMLRMLAVYVITIPLAFSFIPGVALHSVPLLITLPVGVICAAIAGSILFANWRIEGNGLMYAREERQ